MHACIHTDLMKSYVECRSRAREIKDSCEPVLLDYLLLFLMSGIFNIKN